MTRPLDAGPLTAEEVTVLATYNAERGRGIVHTVAWQVEMAVLQNRFDLIGWTDTKGRVYDGRDRPYRKPGAPR